MAAVVLGLMHAILDKVRSVFVAAVRLETFGGAAAGVDGCSLVFLPQPGRGAGHGFQDFCDDNRYRKEAADDAWDKLMTFLDKNLK